MIQDFIVAWVDRLDADQFGVFDSLAEAEEFIDKLTTEESYIYLSVVIKKQ
jgi:hypothetical protein